MKCIIPEKQLNKINTPDLVILDAIGTNILTAGSQVNVSIHIYLNLKCSDWLNYFCTDTHTKCESNQLAFKKLYS